MRELGKDRKFWLCAALFVGLFGLAVRFEHIDKYHPFPYIAVFHALTFLSWLWGLYSRWSGRWKPGDGRVWGGWVLCLALLLQLPMCMVSFVSWVLLGVSLVMGLGGILCSRR